MKKLFSGLFLLSTTAMACPDYSGTYKNCRNISENNKLRFKGKFSQIKISKADYKITWEIVNGRSITYEASCDKKNALASNTIGETYKFGIEEGYFIIKHFSHSNKKNPILIKCDLP